MKIHKAAAFAVCVLLAAAAGRTTGEVEIAVSGDSRGCLIGTVSKDKGRIGLAGEAVTVTGGSWIRNATTGENGLFSVPVPLNAAGKITIAAAGRRLDVDAADLPLRLTAPPLTRRLSLEGTWRILIDPPADWRAAPGWREIRCPPTGK